MNDICSFCECDPLKLGIKLVLKDYLRNKLRDKWKGSEVLDLNEIHLFYKTLGGGSLSRDSSIDNDDKQLVKKGVELQWKISYEDTLKFLVQWAEAKVKENDGGILEEDDGVYLRGLGYLWGSSIDTVGNLWLSMDLIGGGLTREVIRWLVFGGEEGREEGGEWRKCLNHSKFYKVVNYLNLIKVSIKI